MEAIAVACNLPQGSLVAGTAARFFASTLAALPAHDNVDAPAMLFQTIHRYAS
jgi:hypothetical protein